MHTTNNYKPNRQYKSTLFSKLFGEDKANALSLYNAVDRAVDECVEAGVLEFFLSKHRREVKNMVLTEFDEEKFLKMVREEERIENFMSILSDLGEVPAEIKEQVKSLDRDALKAWTKLAARADSMGEFLERISQQ